MSSEGDKSNDFYGVLGLKKECTPAELRLAYKKLAMKWHPDRFSASGDVKYVEVAKKKFQAIQQAYSVLSDDNKRFLYDVGVYDSNDDDDKNGMGDFLNEMATMMSQTKSKENRNETFEDLQEMFDEMFHSDINSSSRYAAPPSCSSSSSSYGETYNISNKRSSTETISNNFKSESSHFEGFSMGTSGNLANNEGGESSRRKNARKSRR